MSKPWQPLLVLCSYNSNGSSSYRRSIIDTKAKDKWCIWWSIDYSARVLQSCSNSSLLVIIMSCCVDNDGSFFTSIIRQDQAGIIIIQHCKWSLIYHFSIRAAKEIGTVLWKDGKSHYGATNDFCMKCDEINLFESCDHDGEDSFLISLCEKPYLVDNGQCNDEMQLR